MSNIPPAQIFHIVASVYSLTFEQLGEKTPGNYQIMPRHIEARGMAVYLTLRHTMETRAGMCRILGLAVNGEARTALTRQATLFERLAQQSSEARQLLELAESLIDHVHETSNPPMPAIDHRQRRRERAARLRPLPPVDVGDMTPEWWQVNDAKFRRGYLQAAE